MEACYFGWLIKVYKIDVSYQVKLLDILLQTIGRYKSRSDVRSVFGKINYWTMYKKLKRL